MKETKAAELKDKSIPELEEMVRQERVNLYNARRDLVFRRMTDTSSLKARRHNIARMLTIISEKKRGNNV
jgi:large subunit ribosomal protein L29